MLLSLWASLVAQMIKNLLAVQQTQVQSLDWEDLLEKGMASHSSILAWRIPWTEDPGKLQSMGSQRVGHDWANNTTTSDAMNKKSVGMARTAQDMVPFPFHKEKVLWGPTLLPGCWLRGQAVQFVKIHQAEHLGYVHLSATILFFKWNIFRCF